jgi:hypothetical protein
MRSIKNLAAIMLLAVTVGMSAQTALAGSGIILLDRTGSAATNDDQTLKSDEAVDDGTGIIVTTLTGIGIILLDLR